MPPTLENVRAAYREQIREGMARMLWILAYADYVDENKDELEDDHRYPRARDGQDWDDVAPETPKAAYKAADDLGKLYEAQNHDLVDLYILAQTADLEEDFELWNSDDKKTWTPSGQIGIEKWKEDDAYEFGGSLAHMALGTGVSWFDDHKEFEIKRPDFECHFDGEELTWNGGVSDVREVAHQLGRIQLINAGDADWTKHSYVLGFGGFTTPEREFVLVYANNLEDAIDELIDWVAEEHPDSLADEQVNEQYQELLAAGTDEAEAQEDAEVDTTRGGNYGHFIHSEDWTIVAEDPSEEDLQKIAKRTNPACDPDYHAKLKHDAKEWSRLEDLGSQPLKKGGSLELRNCDRCGTTLSVKRNPFRPVRWRTEYNAKTGELTTYEPSDDGTEVPVTRTLSARERERYERKNPAGLTSKGERMYEDIKRSYQKKGDPRAKEIASRTVLARAKDVLGLTKNSTGPGPGLWTIVHKDHRDIYWADPQIARELGLRTGWYDFYSRYHYNSKYDQPIALPPDGRWIQERTRGSVDQNRSRQTRSVTALRAGGYVDNPDLTRNAVMGIDDRVLDYYDANTADWATVEGLRRGLRTDATAIERSVARLVSAGMLKRSRDGYSITAKGEARAKQARPNPDREGKARQRAEKVLEKRVRAGFEPQCDDPNCRGWDLFETQHGYGIQACDMCNSAAKREGLPVLADSDAKELAEARRAMARAVRGA